MLWGCRRNRDLKRRGRDSGQAAGSEANHRVPGGRRLFAAVVFQGERGSSVGCGFARRQEGRVWRSGPQQLAGDDARPLFRLDNNARPSQPRLTGQDARLGQPGGVDVSLVHQADDQLLHSFMEQILELLARRSLFSGVRRGGEVRRQTGLSWAMSVRLMMSDGGCGAASDPL